MVGGESLNPTLEDPVTRTRFGLAVVVPALLALIGLAALTGCGAPAVASDNLSAEGQALSAMGFSSADLAAAELSAAPSASPTAGGTEGKRRGLRAKLRKNVLHGETVVQTKDGPRTVAVQRGQVTAVSATSITVKSTDGFSQTWTVGEKFVVVHDKEKVSAGDIKQGAEIGIAGAKDGENPTARLAVLA
jgi:hypothetical protein